jgi:hypothetical protein
LAFCEFFYEKVLAKSEQTGRVMYQPDKVKVRENSGFFHFLGYGKFPIVNRCKADVKEIIYLLLVTAVNLSSASKMMMQSLGQSLIVCFD